MYQFKKKMQSVGQNSVGKLAGKSHSTSGAGGFTLIPSQLTLYPYVSPAQPVGTTLKMMIVPFAN